MSKQPCDRWRPDSAWGWQCVKCGHALTAHERWWQRAWEPLTMPSEGADDAL